MRKQKEPSRLIPAGALLLFVVTVGMFLLVMQARRPAAPAVTPAPGRDAPAAPGIYRPGREPVLGLDVRAQPGVTPTTLLHYRQRGVTNVLIAGSWDGWQRKYPLTRRGDLWVADVTVLGLTLGRYEYKFIPDGQWEPGENRLLFVNKEGRLQRPRDVIFAARMERSDRIDIYFSRPLRDSATVRAQLVPECPIREITWGQGKDGRELLGYAVAGDHVTFCLSEETYGVRLEAGDRVNVAGSFNGWTSTAEGWALTRVKGTRLWEGTFSVAGVGTPPANDLPTFKFVINGARWLDPPLLAPNAESDGEGHVNMVIDPSLSSCPVLHIHTHGPLDLSAGYTVVVESDDERPAYAVVTPGAALDRVSSTRPLGALLDRTGKRTGFRLFAPRAQEVALCLYDGPEYEAPGRAGGFLEPAERHAMTLNGGDGVWEVWLDGLRVGAYYSYRVDGAQGSGDGFNAAVPIGDPYARAVAHEGANSMVMDPTAGQAWFKGWTDSAWRTPAWSEAVIYETHVR
ncbi:MAG: hypothetical protein HN919_19860, partial [Verrucomicrobia bacterium]|nr:hypothetical protein [Verrucomicrobiota bacterium]